MGFDAMVADGRDIYEITVFKKTGGSCGSRFNAGIERVG
jgi:hypothetical protein